MRLNYRDSKTCFDINIPQDVSTNDLHVMAGIKLLQTGRDLNFLCLRVLI